MNPAGAKTPVDLPVALVTGGAVRVGRSICERLAGDSFRVAIHYNGSRQAAADLVKKLADLGLKAEFSVRDLCARRIARFFGVFVFRHVFTPAHAPVTDKWEPVIG